MLDALFSKAGCTVLSVIAVVAFLVGGIASWEMEYGSEANVTFTVQSLQATASGNSSTVNYLVFTTDGQVYQDSDAWLHGKTDSSNVWAKFEDAGVGATWTCPEYGYRIPLTSSYKDLLDGCKLVSPAPAKS
jgi:hypothetical protein